MLIIVDVRQTGTPGRMVLHYLSIGTSAAGLTGCAYTIAMPAIFTQSRYCESGPGMRCCVIITNLNNCRYWLPALALAQSTAPAAVQLWHGAPVAFSARYQLTLFFIVYLVFAPEIFLQGPSFVLAPYSRYAS